MNGLAVFGWIVIACITIFCAVQTVRIFRVSLGFTGRLCGEFYVMVVITGLLGALCYYIMPFHISMNMVG